MTLPLDERWSLAERRAYDRVLRAGDFGACIRMVCLRLSEEQVTAAREMAAKRAAIFKKEDAASPSSPEEPNP